MGRRDLDAAGRFADESGMDGNDAELPLQTIGCSSGICKRNGNAGCQVNAQLIAIFTGANFIQLIDNDQVKITVFLDFLRVMLLGAKIMFHYIYKLQLFTYIVFCM